MASKRHRDDYQEPGKDSKSRVARYRHGVIGDNQLSPLGRYAMVDHNFYPTNCIKALQELGVPLPGHEPLKATA